jgi:outer membrane receptor protein involved in Fe transport
MKNRLAIFTIIMFAIIGNALSKSEISGMVKDSITGEGLPFASVQIISINNSGLIKGAITDFEGNYSIKDILPGKYSLTASYMGYHESKIIVDIHQKKEKYNFLLSQNSISLSEVEISTEKNLIEKSINKTTININKNTTLSGGTGTDVMQTMPSVDIDIDGNINYRGSDKVIILINGEKSELVKSLDQLPADQIEKVELINNPSAKYEAEGMSGIINIVLKTGEVEKNKTTLMINTGYPETIGGNIGYSGMTGKTRFNVKGGMKHNTKFQTKEHLRENYENANAFDYHQYDRQDEALNSAFINSNIEYAISKKQRIGVSLIGSKKFNNASRQIKYETLNKLGKTETKSIKDININLDNYTIDGNLNYKYSFGKGRNLSSKIHYSFFDQLQEMNNEYYSALTNINSQLQNTFSKQINKQTNFSLNYLHPFNDSIKFETGYNYDVKDLMNDFNSESYTSLGEWINDMALANKFNYKQLIHAIYLDFNAQLKYFTLQAGLRSEFTENTQNNTNTEEYIDYFPSVNISRKLNPHFTIFAAYNRRINRPTIKMLNPFSDEYADILNMHNGNPDLNPEYVNSVEIGNRFIFNNFSGFGSIYYRNIDQAISRIKSASNDSAMFVTFMNLDKAKLTGVEISFTYRPFEWWSINSSNNLFYTNLTGIYGNNLVNNSKTGWTLNISTNFKLLKNFGFQLSTYYRSKLPSVMGTYKERYYFDLALNKKILKNKGQLIFKISDVFNTYKYGLDLDAIDDNNFRYKQTNRRKNESQYFVLSFIYNINGKDQQQKKQNGKFFLDDFDK